MTPAQALIELRAHPRKWLEKHHLMVFAGIPGTFSAQQPNFGNTGYVDALGIVGPAGDPVFNRTVGSARTFGPWTGTDRRGFAICSPGNHQAQFVGVVAQASVINVPVVGSATLAGYAGIALDDLGTALGRDLAVTTLLNGCCYVMDGANPQVKHVQPTGGISSLALRNALQPHYTAVFGGGGTEYDQALEDVTILGVRRGGGWKIYAQVHTRNARDVRRVVKIHG